MSHNDSIAKTILIDNNNKKSESNQNGGSKKVYSFDVHKNIEKIDKPIAIMVKETIKNVYKLCHEKLDNNIILSENGTYCFLQILNLDKFISCKKIKDIQRRYDYITTCFNQKSDKTLCFKVVYKLEKKINNGTLNSIATNEKKQMDETIQKYVNTLKVNYNSTIKLSQKLIRKIERDRIIKNAIRRIQYKLCKDFLFSLNNTQFNITQIFDDYITFECLNINNVIPIDKLYDEFIAETPNKYKDVLINCVSNSIQFKIPRYRVSKSNVFLISNNKLKRKRRLNFSDHVEYHDNKKRKYQNDDDDSDY